MDTRGKQEIVSSNFQIIMQKSSKTSQIMTKTTQHTVKHNQQHPTNYSLHSCALYITDTLEITGCNSDSDTLLELINNIILKKRYNSSYQEPLLIRKEISETRLHHMPSLLENKIG